MNELDSEIIYTIETYPLNHDNKNITYGELLKEIDYEMTLVTKEEFLAEIERLIRFGIIRDNNSILSINSEEKEKLIFLADKLNQIDISKN